MCSNVWKQQKMNLMSFPQRGSPVPVWWAAWGERCIMGLHFYMWHVRGNQCDQNPILSRKLVGPHFHFFLSSPLLYVTHVKYQWEKRQKKEKKHWENVIFRNVYELVHMDPHWLSHCSQPCVTWLDANGWVSAVEWAMRLGVTPLGV